tara:strand:- start:51524 stop:51700 length:177 start_codon:yes stop_codon:yes gene_type:complete
MEIFDNPVIKILEIAVYAFFGLAFFRQINWRDPKTYKVSALTLAVVGLGVGLLSIILG